MINRISITALENANASLKESIDVYNTDYAAARPALVNSLKAAVIQNFEFTFELAWKMMDKWLNENVTPGITLGISKRALYTLAAEKGLISDLQAWQSFQNARNKTSHTYDKAVALDVFSIALDFPATVDDLISKLSS